MCEDLMSLALEQAHQAALRDEVPVGALIVNDEGVIVAQSGNRCEELRDPTAHAEMLVIRQALKVLGQDRLDDFDLYVTLEPCAMCAQAISWVRLRRVYFGAYDPKSGGVEHGARVYDHSTCHHKPEVYGGIHEEACGHLLKSFFEKKRG